MTDFPTLTAEECAATPTAVPLDGRFICRRSGCDHTAQVQGGYCPCCFRFIMSLPRRPEVVVLCGSTRFYDQFQEWNFKFTMQGKVVLSVGFYPHADPDRWAVREHGETVGVTPEQKDDLDELHKRKIDMADRVFVLNVGGYVGESTRSEIEYAEWFGKPVDYLECRHEWTPWRPSRSGLGTHLRVCRYCAETELKTEEEVRP